ncbi:hypothetical protein ONS95_010129 [Cadophora gregata]|uniref:uncharacterized protein n=1 Tax=Cadophora gregata TaxID=51156 RepID=UPI0026DBC674|nr:uncharacterized protein ONS95_010129 [Cadophora gregata]KAK0121850.1 hypothetical protein ONS95_010129 [Cadophora gregata]KAK0127328.1 hypothetical protein ONS96_006876 [Cadophora gregata f. sp. sojae]
MITLHEIQADYKVASTREEVAPQHVKGDLQHDVPSHGCEDNKSTPKRENGMSSTILPHAAVKVLQSRDPKTLCTGLNGAFTESILLSSSRDIPDIGAFFSSHAWTRQIDNSSGTSCHKIHDNATLLSLQQQNIVKSDRSKSAEPKSLFSSH